MCFSCVSTDFTDSKVWKAAACKGAFNTPKTASLPWCLQQLHVKLRLHENSVELDWLSICARICGPVELN